MNDNSINLEYIPITSIKNASKDVLSMLLNPCKVISTEEGLPRDWRGLAHLVGVPGELMPSLEASPDPLSEVLSFWNQKNGHTANIKNLQHYLERIDRYDVLDDTRESLDADAVSYTNRSSNRSVPCNPEQNLSTSLPDQNVLTVQDANLSQQGYVNPQMYDAFVLYADEDADFAEELILRMEAFGFVLCVKDRDLLGGLSSQHSAVMRLISERCNRLIVIISPAFFESPANTFFIDFAQAIGIEQGRRKIIPCLYKDCRVPPQLSFYCLLKYRTSQRLYDFWDRLSTSIKQTPTPLVINQGPIIRELEADTRSLAIQSNEIRPKLAITDCVNNEVTIVKPTAPEIDNLPPYQTLSNNNNSTLTIPMKFISTSLIDVTASTVPLLTDTHSLTISKSIFTSMHDTSHSIVSNDIPFKKDRSKKSKWFKKLLPFNSFNQKIYDENGEAVKKNKKSKSKKTLIAE